MNSVRFHDYLVQSASRPLQYALSTPREEKNVTPLASKNTRGDRMALEYGVRVRHIILPSKLDELTSYTP